MKVMNKNYIIQKKYLHYVVSEFEIMKMLSGFPFVIDLHYCFQSANYLYMIIDSLINYMKLVIFFLVFLIYMSFKFGYFMLNIESMSRFIEVYNITQNCQTNTIYTVDVIKSYLFNSNISITDGIDNKITFVQTYKSISDKLEQMIIETSRTSSFLSGDYQKKFREYSKSK